MTHTRLPDAASRTTAVPVQEPAVDRSASSPDQKLPQQTVAAATKPHQDRLRPPPTERSASSERVRADIALGLDRGDRRIVTFASIIALTLMCVHWWRIAVWSPAPVRVERPAGAEYRFVLDINRATWVEWMQIEGVGETLARRIVANRDELGPFPDVESVQRVPGIGAKTLERMRPYAIADQSAAAASASE